MASIDWETINSKLPHQRNRDEYNQRKKIWASMDVNGNGILSLAEVNKGIRDVIHVESLFDCTPAISRAFHYAKDISENNSPDFIEFREFRIFLQALRQFFEYYQAFDRIDTGGDNRVSKEEFTSKVIKETIEKWVGPIEDMDAEFDIIDANGGGQILFSEFVDWALKKNLDIEDDIDEP